MFILCASLGAVHLAALQVQRPAKSNGSHPAQPANGSHGPDGLPYNGRVRPRLCWTVLAASTEELVPCHGDSPSSAHAMLDDLLLLLGSRMCLPCAPGSPFGGPAKACPAPPAAPLTCASLPPPWCAG